MALEFHTGLATAQRTALRRAVVDRLSLLKRPSLYLESVKPFGLAVAGTMSDDEVAAMNHVTGGKYPAALVSLGGKSYEPEGIGRERYRASVTLQVIVVSRNLRGLLARTEQDAASEMDDAMDPGVEAILEHCEELLLGYQITDPSLTIYGLTPVAEGELRTGSDVTIWQQTYSVQLDRAIKRHRNVTELVTALRAEYHEAESELQNPLITAEHAL